MKTKKTQTPKQKLSSMLKRKEFAGCRGQVSHHGMGKVSIQIFKNTQLVADINL